MSISINGLVRGQHNQVRKEYLSDCKNKLHISQGFLTILCQSTQNAYCQNQADYGPTYYHPECQSYPSFTWDNSQEQSGAPNFSYQAEFAYQPPPQYAKTSKLEEVLSQYLEQQEERRLEEFLSKFIEQNEVRMTNQDASLRNLESQMGKLVNAIMNPPQSSLPSVTEIEPNEGGEEQCMVNTEGNGEELHKIVEGDVEMHLGQTVDSEVGENRSVIGCNFTNNEELEATLKVVEIIEDPIEHEECFQIDLLKGELVDNLNNESFFVPIDEVELGSSIMQVHHANQRKDK